MKSLKTYVKESNETKSTEYLKYSFDEMVKDYNLMDGWPEMAEKKATAAKYHINSKKAQEIKDAIIEQIRFERNERKTYTDEDLKWFYRQDIPERYDKLEPYLKEETPEFIKFWMDSLKDKMEKADVFKWRTYANQRDIRMTYSEKRMCKLYCACEQYLDNIDPDKIAAKKVQEDISNVIKTILLDQLKDFHDEYINRVTEDAKKYWKNLPTRIEEAKEKIKKADDAMNVCHKKYDSLEHKERRAYYHSYEYQDAYKYTQKTRNDYNKLVAIKDRYKTSEKYVEQCVEDAENKYQYNINSVTERIKERDLNTANIKVIDVANDPKFYAMTITDGEKKIYCRSVWAAEYSDVMIPHFRFIITNRK